MVMSAESHTHHERMTGHLRAATAKMAEHQRAINEAAQAHIDAHPTVPAATGEPPVTTTPANEGA